MAIPYQTVPRPFTNDSVDDNTNSQIKETGLNVAENVEYTKRGTMRKRPGVELEHDLFLHFNSDSDITKAGRLVSHSSAACLALVHQKAALVNQSDKVTGEHYYRDRVSNCYVRSKGIRRELMASLRDPQVAIANGWEVYVWWRDDGSESVLYYQVREQSTGSIHSEGILADAGSTPMLCLGSSQNYLFCLYQSGTTTLRAAVMQLNVASPSWSATSEIESAIHSSATFDAFHRGTGDSIYYAYLNTSDNIVVKTLDAVLSVGSFATINPTNAVAKLAIALATGTTNRLCVLYYQGTVLKIQYRVLDGVGAEFLGETDVYTIGAGGIFGNVCVSPTGSATTFFFSWFNDAKGFGWARGTTGGTVTATTNGGGRMWPISKILTHESRAYQWLYSRNDGLNAVALLVELPLDTAGVAPYPPVLSPPPVASAAYNSISSDARVIMTAWATADTDVYVTAHSYLFAPAAGRTAVQDVRTYFDAPELGDSAHWGPVTYWSGGCLQQYAGKNVVENGFLQAPKISIADGGTGAGPTAGALYTYVEVYEWVDQAGQFHRSVVSKPATITAANTGASGFGSTSITSEFLNATQRQRVVTGFGIEDEAVTLAIYRTLANGEIFYRLWAYGQEPMNAANEAAFPTTAGGTLGGNYLDEKTDSAIESNATLYTTGGLLDVDPVHGGCTTIWTHKGRMWAGGGEDPSILWYSQEFIPGEPPNFSIFLQLQIPGETVVCGRSLDEASVVLTESGAFVIYGEGPNSLGADGAFTIPQRIPGAHGCISQRSVVVTPDGLWYQSARGLCLIDRSRAWQLVGTPVEDVTQSATYQGYCAGAVYHEGRDEVRFLFRSSDWATHYLLVFHRPSGKWSKWVYSQQASHSPGSIVMHDGGMQLLMDNGRWHEEIQGKLTDNGNQIRCTVETGDMQFGSFAAQKRMRRAGIVFENDQTNAVAHTGLIVSCSYNGHDFEVIGTWQPDELLAIAARGENTIRWHMKRQKAHRHRFKIREATPTHTASVSLNFELVGMMFEVGSEGGVQRMPAAESK